MIIRGISKVGRIENLKPVNYYGRENDKNSSFTELKKDKKGEQFFEDKLKEKMQQLDNKKSDEEKENVKIVSSRAHIKNIILSQKPIMPKHEENAQARMQKAQKAYNMENKSARTKMEETNNESIIEEVQSKSRVEKDAPNTIVSQPDWHKVFSPGELQIIFVLRIQLANTAYFLPDGNADPVKMKTLIREIEIGLWDNYLFWEYESYQNIRAQHNLANIIQNAVGQQMMNTTIKVNDEKDNGNSSIK